MFFRGFLFQPIYFLTECALEFNQLFKILSNCIAKKISLYRSISIHEFYENYLYFHGYLLFMYFFSSFRSLFSLFSFFPPFFFLFSFRLPHFFLLLIPLSILFSSPFFLFFFFLSGGISPLPPPPLAYANDSTHNYK